MYKKSDKSEAWLYAWLFDSTGHDFFVKGLWARGTPCDTYSMEGSETEPLSIVTRTFREYLLEKAVKSLVLPGYIDGLEFEENQEERYAKT